MYLSRLKILGALLLTVGYSRVHGAVSQLMFKSAKALRSFARAYVPSEPVDEVIIAVDQRVPPQSEDQDDLLIHTGAILLSRGVAGSLTLVGMGHGEHVISSRNGLHKKRCFDDWTVKEQPYEILSDVVSRSGR